MSDVLAGSSAVNTPIKVIVISIHSKGKRLLGKNAFTTNFRLTSAMSAVHLFPLHEIMVPIREVPTIVIAFSRGSAHAPVERGAATHATRK